MTRSWRLSTSGRAPASIASAGSSVHDGIFFDPEDHGPTGQGLADDLATFSSADGIGFLGPDQQFAALRAGRVKRLAEHIPGPQRTTIFDGRMHVKERRLTATVQTGLVSVEEALDIVLYINEETLLDQALQVDIEASYEISIGI